MSSGIEEHDGDIVFGLKPVEKSGRWRVLLRPHLTSRFAQDLPELADLANRCAIGRRHRTPHKAAQDVLQYTDPRRNTVVHTFDSGQINPRTGQPVNGAALPVQTIERDGPLIRVQYGENGEMLLLPIDDERSSIPDDMGNFLLRGAWARDGGSGCIEFRLNVRSREGKGTVWLGLRNRFGIDVKGVTKEPLRSTLKVFPN